jgi:hypothetical protein
MIKIIEIKRKILTEKKGRKKNNTLENTYYLEIKN